MSFVSKVVRLLNNAFVSMAGVLLVGMIFLTCTNVLLRLFGKPIDGTYELMGFFGAVCTAFALGYAQIRRAHIAVDILVHNYSPRIRKTMNAVNAMLGMVFFALITWQIIKWGNVLRATGDITDTLQIIYYPFTYATAAGCAFLSLVSFYEFIKAFSAEKGS